MALRWGLFPGCIRGCTRLFGEGVRGADGCPRDGVVPVGAAAVVAHGFGEAVRVAGGFSFVHVGAPFVGGKQVGLAAHLGEAYPSIVFYGVALGASAAFGADDDDATRGTGGVDGGGFCDTANAGVGEDALFVAAASWSSFSLISGSGVKKNRTAIRNGLAECINAAEINPKAPAAYTTRPSIIPFLYPYLFIKIPAGILINP